MVSSRTQLTGKISSENIAITTRKTKTLATSCDQLSETDLRIIVDKFFDSFPKEYTDNVLKSAELQLIDNRWFSPQNNRFLDEVLTTVSLNGDTVLTEFKKGKITLNILNDCIYTRGYLQLSYEQVPNFKIFVFVGEEIDKSCKELCAKISQNEHDIKVVAITYPDYLKSMFERYVKWALTRKIPKALIWKQAVISQEFVSVWLSDEWLIGLENII